MCMFSMRSIDLELALIDHILFPFSLALPPTLPLVYLMLGAQVLSTSMRHSDSVINVFIQIRVSWDLGVGSEDKEQLTGPL